LNIAANRAEIMSKETRKLPAGQPPIGVADGGLSHFRGDAALRPEIPAEPIARIAERVAVSEELADHVLGH
jgi:hypothetical protein